jgi:transcriptional regulator with XRE-family HTH domain
MEKMTGRLIGQRIGDIRAAQGMTQARLAREMSEALGCEVKPLIVTRIEGGKRPLIVDELVVIARVLDVDVAELLRTTGSPLPRMELQRARIEYDNACDALRTADGARMAAITRWRAAHGALVAAYDNADASDSAKFLSGYSENIAMFLGDQDDHEA